MLNVCYGFQKAHSRYSLKYFLQLAALSKDQFLWFAINKTESHSF